MTTYDLIESEAASPIKAWTKGVIFDPNARQQLLNIARLPIVHRWVAAMPDVHLGLGATVGTVIPTIDAIIPAAVGVDIGCGMMAVKTSLVAADLPDNLAKLRSAIERAVPHGRTLLRNRRARDQGAWGEVPDDCAAAWQRLKPGFERICAKHPVIENTNNVHHLGTLGTGNHFIEICLDESQSVWAMLHSGSRGVGNRIGRHFIELAKLDAERHQRNLPDADLAYLTAGAAYFDDYVEAVGWAQDFARENRRLMMNHVLDTMGDTLGVGFDREALAVNCHHNYVRRERHFGADCWVTRKGAISARQGELGIIPGSMGAASYIVRGRGNAESFTSASHGAGRVLSRNAAKKHIDLEQHRKAVAGVECRIDADVIDESPAAYKSIDAVMNAQRDLVEVVHRLKQVLCVKG